MSLARPSWAPALEGDSFAKITVEKMHFFLSPANYSAEHHSVKCCVWTANGQNWFLAWSSIWALWIDKLRLGVSEWHKFGVIDWENWCAAVVRIQPTQIAIDNSQNTRNTYRRIEHTSTWKLSRTEWGTLHVVVYECNCFQLRQSINKWCSVYSSEYLLTVASNAWCILLGKWKNDISLITTILIDKKVPSHL